MRSRTVALIPARYAATRFPGKLLAKINGKSVIRHTYDATVATGLFDEVLVVCDSPALSDEITRHGGRARLSAQPHNCGTNRIAEAAAQMTADIIVNVQGDTPFISRRPLEQLLAALGEVSGRPHDVASLMRGLPPEEADNPNRVKVAVNLRSQALFFSRARIPWHRPDATRPDLFEHIGVYAFRRQALLSFASLPQGPLERLESIECLRFLEHGMSIVMVRTDYSGVEIDTPEDLERAAMQAGAAA